MASQYEVQRDSPDTALDNSAKLPATSGHYVEHPDILFATVQLSPVSMILTNPRLRDNPIVFANRAFCAMTGYDLSEILGRNCRFLQGEGSDPETISEIRKGLAAGGEVTTKILNYRKDGTQFWNVLQISSLYSKDGELAWFVAAEMPLAYPDRGPDSEGPDPVQDWLAAQTPSETSAKASARNLAANELASQRFALLAQQLTADFDTGDGTGPRISGGL